MSAKISVEADGSWFPEASALAERVRGMDEAGKAAFYRREARARGVARRQIGRLVEAAEYVHAHDRAGGRARRVRASVASIERLRAIAGLDLDAALEMNDAVLRGDIGEKALTIEERRLAEAYTASSRLSAILDRERVVKALLDHRPAWNRDAAPARAVAVAGLHRLSPAGEVCGVEGEALDPGHMRRVLERIAVGDDDGGPMEGSDGMHLRAAILSPLIRGSRDEGRGFARTLERVVMAAAVYAEVRVYLANEAEAEALATLVRKAPSALGGVAGLEAADLVGRRAADADDDGVVRPDFRGRRRS